MHQFEKDEMAGDRSDPTWRIFPQPSTKYQVYFEYLADLCELMQERTSL